MERRKFIGTAGTILLAQSVLGTSTVAFGKSSKEKGFNGHIFPELPYNYDALDPYIDARTMELHYDKHFRGYFNKFTAAIKGTDAVNLPMEKIFTKITQYGDAVRNNGGGYYNHWLFWESMSPAKTTMSPELEQGLIKNFGSVDQFRENFGNTAKKHFGSGWAWLVAGPDGKLFVTDTLNQDNPLMNDAPLQGTPLLGLDVWEHAYYLHYQNRRAAYVDNFWNIVNWKAVSSRYHEANS